MPSLKESPSTPTCRLPVRSTMSIAALDLLAVALERSGKHRGFHIHLPRLVGQRPQILGQAGPPEGEAGLQVRGGDVQLGVRRKDLHHLVAVDPECLADVTDFIGKRDLEAVEGVASVLHHLGGPNLRHVQRRIDRRVEGRQRLRGNLRSRRRSA